MSRLDSLKEATRGIGVTCQCGKPGRITARGQTLCYECFDEEMGYILDPAGCAEQRMRERIREIDRRYLTRGRRHLHPAVTRSWAGTLPASRVKAAGMSAFSGNARK